MPVKINLTFCKGYGRRCILQKFPRHVKAGLALVPQQELRPKGVGSAYLNGCNSRMRAVNSLPLIAVLIEAGPASVGLRINTLQ